MSVSRQRNAELYDVAVPDWPGEIDLYLELAGQASTQGQPVLEVACGTGRVALRLAAAGATIVGLDRSPEMLAVARRKGAGLANVRWVEADMRSFDLGQAFGLIIVPGHAFHNLETPADQLATLARIKQHLLRDGLFVLHLDHQDLGWLGEIGGGKKGVMELKNEVRDPLTGNLVRTQRAWAYERATQTASSWSVSEELDEDGAVVDRWRSGPWRLHCFFRYEVEHLLALAGFRVEALHGDFFRQPLTDDSSEMIWVARAAQS